MLKVALINPSQVTKYPQPPMGLASIAAVLEGEGYKITAVDANALRLQPEDIVPFVADADVVGITAMTPTINAAASIARHLKQVNPNLTIILGGAHATLLPEETMISAPEIDILVRGEGEEIIIELLNALENKRTLNNVPGISYRDNGKVVLNKTRSGAIDLDSLPFLAYHLLPWQRYKPIAPHGRVFPFAAIITSRGCPYQCSYCSKPVFGENYRYQSPKRVVDEIVYHQTRFGIKEFAFYDDNFTLDKERAYAISDEIIKRNLKIEWTCETRANLVNKDLLCHMKQAGCYSIAYGIESGSQAIINTLNKNITLEQAEEAVRLSREIGLQTIGYFMIGSPGETPETIKQTIQFAKKLKLDFAQFSITTPFPGTKLYELYLNGSKIEQVPWESFVYADFGKKLTPFFENSQLNRDDIQDWVKQAYKEFYLRPAYIWQRIRNTTSIGDLRIGIRGLSMFLGNV